MHPIPTEKPIGLAPVVKGFLFTFSVLGSLVMFGVFVAIPTFRAMLEDFGSELPVVTRCVLSGRWVYLFAGMFFGAISSFVLYGKRTSTSAQLWIFGMVGAEFLLFLIGGSALFMPILQLASASPGA